MSKTLLLAAVAGLALTTPALAETDTVAAATLPDTVASTMTVQAAAPAAAPAAQPSLLSPSRALLTGDWGGLRTKLKNDGITLTANYASESAVLLNDGGRGRTGDGAITHEINVRSVFDLGKLGLIEGGTINVAMEYRDGNSLTADKIGNLFNVQQLFGAGMDLRPAEATYAQSFNDDKVNLKIGLTHVGDDMASSSLNCLFQSFSICPRSPAIIINSGFSGYPVPRWGARLRVRPATNWTVVGGIYEVNPRRAVHKDGWDLGLDSDGALFASETAWAKPDGQGQGWGVSDKPGLYHVGGYWETTRRADAYSDATGGSYVLNRTPAAIRDGRFGLWAMAEQMVWRDGPSSLTVFANAYAFDKNTAVYDSYYSAGAVRRGTFKARPKDMAGFAVTWLGINDRRQRAQADAVLLNGTGAIQTEETNVEAFYAIQATGWLVVRPNIQFIDRPGATGNLPDAWVSGLTLRVAL
jgi:porin